MCSNPRCKLISTLQNHMQKVSVKLFLNRPVCFRIMFKTYKKKKESNEKKVNTLLIVVLLLIVCGVVFLTYHFFQRISNNDAYSIGSGNRYMNMIQNRIHGEKDEDEEVISINLDAIKKHNQELIHSSLKEIRIQEEGDELAFAKRYTVNNEEELNSDSYVVEPNEIPGVLFTALSTPVFLRFFYDSQSNAVGSKFPDISMLSMSDLKIDTLSRVIYSKSTVVKNLAKGHTDIKRETHFA